MDAHCKIPCSWQVEFRITPSLRQSETMKDYNFEVCNGSMYVKVRYKTPTYDEKLPDRRTDDEYAEQTLAHRHSLCIGKLMLKYMVYQKIVKPLKVEIVKPGPILCNENDLCIAGLLKKRVVSKVLMSKYNILDTGDSLKESEDFWQSGFKNRTSGCENNILRIVDWVQRAEVESDKINSFILTWIGFNGLYGLFDLITGNHHNDNASKFEFMIDELLKNEAADITRIYSNRLDVLESYSFKSAKGNRDWSDEFKNERRKAKRCDLAVLKHAVKCIYAVRREVFHEAPQPEHIDERTEHSKLMLMPILLTCLRNFVTY